jgi:putative DNA primase/helicase
MNDHPRLDDNGRAALRDAAAEIVSYFLRQDPNPKLSKPGRGELRWHPHGSFVLATAGPRAGCWYDHASGEGGDIIALIRRELGCSFLDALDFAADFASELRPAPKPQVTINLKLPDDEARTAEALAIWHRSVPLRGTLAEDYLRSRGIEVPDIALEVLRFHPACPWGSNAGPCMVALVTDIVSDEPVGIHRTALTSDGLKFGRKALGPVGGGAIKLTPQRMITSELTIAEGIETALSAGLLGFGPVWSVIDAGGIGRFPVLPSLKVVQMFSGQSAFGHLAEIERLTIMADNDISGAGQRAARIAQIRWEAEGIRVRIVTPSRPGHDANDVLKALKGRP